MNRLVVCIAPGSETTVEGLHSALEREFQIYSVGTSVGGRSEIRFLDMEKRGTVVYSVYANADRTIERLREVLGPLGVEILD